MVLVWMGSLNPLSLLIGAQRVRGWKIHLKMLNHWSHARAAETDSSTGLHNGTTHDPFTGGLSSNTWPFLMLGSIQRSNPSDFTSWNVFLFRNRGCMTSFSFSGTWKGLYFWIRMLFPEVSLWRGGMPIPMGLLYYSYSANASTRGIHIRSRISTAPKQPVESILVGWLVW